MIRHSLTLFPSTESQTAQTKWQCQICQPIQYAKGLLAGTFNPQAHEISAFVPPSGLCQYMVMPFGMKNAPATFQRMVNKLVGDIDGCEGY